MAMLIRCPTPITRSRRVTSILPSARAGPLFDSNEVLKHPHEAQIGIWRAASRCFAALQKVVGSCIPPWRRTGFGADPRHVSGSESGAFQRSLTRSNKVLSACGKGYADTLVPRVLASVAGQANIIVDRHGVYRLQPSTVAGHSDLDAQLQHHRESFPLER